MFGPSSDKAQASSLVKIRKKGQRSGRKKSLKQCLLLILLGRIMYSLVCAFLMMETSILLFGLVINSELKRGQLLHDISPGPEF